MTENDCNNFVAAFRSKLEEYSDILEEAVLFKQAVKQDPLMLGRIRESLFEGLVGMYKDLIYIVKKAEEKDEN